MKTFKEFIEYPYKNTGYEFYMYSNGVCMVAKYDVDHDKKIMKAKVPLDDFLDNERNLEKIYDEFYEKGLITGVPETRNKNQQRADVYFCIKDYFSKNKKPFDLTVSNGQINRVETD